MNILLFNTKKATAFLALCLFPTYFACVNATYDNQKINHAAAKFKRQRGLVRKQLGLEDFYKRDDDEASGNVFYTILGAAAGTFGGFHPLNIKKNPKISKGTIHKEEDLKKWGSKSNTNVMLTIGAATLAGAMLYTILTYLWKWYFKLPQSANDNNINTNQLAQEANDSNHA